MNVKSDVLSMDGIRAREAIMVKTGVLCGASLSVLGSGIGILPIAEEYVCK